MALKSYCLRCLEDIGACACSWNEIVRSGLGFKTLEEYQVRLLREQKAITRSMTRSVSRTPYKPK